MNTLNQQQLRNAEQIARITMILILLTAGISKFFSNGGFYGYYSGLFQSDLRIVLPELLVNSYLSLIPFIELLLGLALLNNRWTKYTLIGWFLFMWSLLIGHYILQEWSAVNQMLLYIILGIICYILPKNNRWFRHIE